MTTTVNTRTPLYKGRVFRLIRENVTLDNGVTADLDYIEHPGAAAIVPLIGADEVVLIKQYRHALKRYIWEIPAGTLGPQEQAADCARGSTYLLTPETYEEMVAHATMTAAPENYAIQAQMILLWPSNDVTRTIVVSWAGRVTMSASNSSSCVWTNEAEELIRMHSTVDLCENFLLDLPRADRARGREAQALQQILSETVKRLGIGRNMRAFL